MTWIRTVAPTPDQPELQAAMAGARRGYPVEYGPARASELRLPPMGANESIVASHSLIPAALEHIFAGYAAMLDPKLPLSRRDHELIAATVSGLNSCYY